MLTPDFCSRLYETFNDRNAENLNIQALINCECCLDVRDWILGVLFKTFVSRYGIFDYCCIPS